MHNSHKQTDAAMIVRVAVSTLLVATSADMTLLRAGQESRPNIVLCMADDQGWGDVGYYGKSIAQTPVLDEMAATGLRFDHFYAACPVCSPTRGSVLTGRHPNRFGCFSWGHSLRPEEVTVAEALQSAGYATGHFGKWHLGSVDPRSDVCPGASGFERWVSSPNFFENDPLMSHNGKVVRLQGESSAVTMQAAIDFMQDCSAKQQPFLAVVWFGSPHSPHLAVERDRAPYANQPERLQHYYGEITGIDRSMGTLRAALRELQIAEHTLVWSTSDNGPQGPLNRNLPGSAGGLRDRKGTVWEGGLRVPTIIEWPERVQQHRICEVPCSTLDIYPTLLSLTGVEIPRQPRLDGNDILPVIDGVEHVRQRPLGFWSYPARGSGMNSTQILEELERSLASGTTPDSDPNDAVARGERAEAALKDLEKYGPVGHAAWLDNRYKLHRIQITGDSKVQFELYDLKSDPAEHHDLHDALPDRVELMKQQLAAWQQSVTHSLTGADYVAN